MTSYGDISHLLWGIEDIFAVLGLSEDAEQRATIARAFITNSISPAFPMPLPCEKVAMKVYKKYVTKAMKRRNVIRCGSDEFFSPCPMAYAGRCSTFTRRC